MEVPVQLRFRVLLFALSIGLAHDVAAQSWVNLTPGSGSAPAARRNASAVLDAAHNRVVVFGGFSSTYLNDIWAFDLGSNTWADLTPATGSAPAPRLTPAAPSCAPCWMQSKPRGRTA
jgi:Galactose oxidase, central domain